AEAALLQTRERHRVIVDTALDGVVTMDARGFITEWNVQAAQIFGWTREEALGRKLSETIVLPHDEKTSARVFRRFVETREGPTLNQRIEVMASHRDGHEFPIELSVSPARLGAEPVLNAFVRDITIRKRAERRLASQYAVTRVLVEAADLQEAGPRILQTICETLEWELGAFWCVDKQADVLRCLDIWRAPTLEADDFIAATRERSFSMGTGLPGRIWGNGKPVWVSDVVVDQNFPRASVAAKVGLHGAFGFPILVGGDVVGVIELFSRQVREPDQDLLRMVADIGLKIGQFRERTRAEEALHHTEARLRQSQKMEAVGRLAGGVAHDFNNLLTVIRGYSELILNRLSQADPMRKEMEEVKKASDRAAGLTSQLLAFSRRQYITPKIVDLNAVVSNVDGMLRRLVGEDIIELCAVLDPDLGRIKADPGQIEQVIMNLAVNARDAMPGGGRLTIETRNVTVTERIGALPSIVEPGSYVMLMVKDTGCGMEEDTQSHLFEPFFTTKEKGKGTGLGLSTVYGIVRQNSGSISVESALGLGTTFKMYFPQVGDPATEADSAALTLDRIRGHETVLLVEDEPGVRGLVHETLRLQGYAVLEARHGIEALLTGAKHMGPIHLLLTDVVMPQMSGPEVAEKLSSVRPDLKVLYMSGYPDHPVFSRDGIKTDRAFLQKPFTTYTLIQKVREVLDTVGK
ncbi:MAG: PAS domain S-box protein, partial [Nitrospiraceae bacterium]